MIHDLAIASATAAITTTIGIIALPVANALNRYLDRFRDHVKLGTEVLSLLDKRLVNGDPLIQSGFYTAAVSYATDLSGRDVEPKEIAKAAQWAVDNFSAKVFDRKAKEAIVKRNV